MRLVTGRDDPIVMLTKTKCEKATTKRFKNKLKPYHHHFERCNKAVCVHHGREDKVRLGDLVTIPDSDLHHVMDSEAMLAISHAIEDIAGEVRRGELIATFQDFANFLPHKKRYMSLAEDLDAVRVWGCGEIPKNAGKIDFVQAEEERIRRYWLVLFDSEESRAVLLCKQVNRAAKFEDKKFIGFYSFNPYLVQSIRWRFNLLSSGLSRVISHWEKSYPFPDLKMRDLERYIKQPDAVDV
jgi:DICT domain-containing protein